MAEPLITLDAEQASVQPGGQARVTVTITNTGTLVEGYRLQVLGPAAAWSQVTPAEVSVYPQQSATVAVVFSPPSGAAAPGGVHPFGVLARSTLDPRLSAVAEGDVEVAQVFGLQARIVPVTSAGRWRGRHTLHVSNGGNAAAQLRVLASDPDDALGFYPRPAIFDLPPGGRVTVALSARARHPFLRGTPVRLPFQVVCERLDAPPGAPGPRYADPSRPVVDAAFTQRPILSAGFITAAVALVTAIAGLVAFLLLRPAAAEVPLAGRGAPPKPKLAVTATGPTSIGLRWDQVESADSYQLQQVDRNSQDVVKPYEPFVGANTYTVPDLPSSAEACFRLRVVRGGVTGLWSDLVCAKTKTAPPSPTASPTSASPVPVTALRAVPGSITVDGNTADWQWQQVARADQPISGQPAATGDVYLAWDDQALYLMAVVHDASLESPDPANPSQIYRGDAVVLELGADKRSLASGDLARPSDAYYMFGLGMPTPVIGVLQPNAGGTSFDRLGDASQLTAAITTSADGYVLEARIPWTATGLNGIGASATLAANVVVCDRNHGMASTNPLRTVDHRAHPFYWQDLQLLPGSPTVAPTFLPTRRTTLRPPFRTLPVRTP